MASGKTTLGKALAKELGVDFIDLDWYIESRYHKTISEIFKEKGEDGFRKIEKNMLHEVAEFENVVISCGGGTPCFFDNMDYMNLQGETIYLDASIECLVRRLGGARSQRPILANKTDEELEDFIRAALEQRGPFYSKAKLRLDSSCLESVSQIRDTVSKTKEILGLR